jgi:sugar phosphate isomerase/epimerase
MKIGVLGMIMSDLTDVDYELARRIAELGFHGTGAHLTVPASSIAPDTAANVKALLDAVGVEFLQLWGPYPCIIIPDEAARQQGVDGACALVRLAAQMGVPAAGIRPTSLNPRGDWWPHPDNFSQRSEDLFVQSLSEILQTAEDYDIDIVLETHVTTVLNTPERIRRVIERAASPRVKLNLDPCNFIGDLEKAFNPEPVIDRLFTELAEYIATVHVKDYYLEDRFVIHITETVIGTGLMDIDAILRRLHAIQPDGYVIVEHLPVDLIPLAKRNLTERIQRLGLPIG